MTDFRSGHWKSFAIASDVILRGRLQRGHPQGDSPVAPTNGADVDRHRVSRGSLGLQVKQGNPDPASLNNVRVFWEGAGEPFFVQWIVSFAPQRVRGALSCKKAAPGPPTKNS